MTQKEKDNKRDEFREMIQNWVQDPDEFINFLLEIKSEKPKNLWKRISDILREIGVPANLKGHEFLRDAIELYFYSPEEYLGAITKSLYPDVAKKNNTTSSRVERAIRHAIEVAWERGDPIILKKYFGNSLNKKRGNPSNSEFISEIADKLRVEME